MNTHSTPRTTQAAEGLLRRAWTVAEIEEMVKRGFIDEHERFELIGGEIVPMSPKGIRHEVYKGSLNAFWMKRKASTYQIIQETTFKLDDFAFVEPDFVFYDAKAKRAELAPRNTLLAVEIADTSLSYDLGRKPRIYANAGVKALWVIDVATLDTHIFENPGIDGYTSVRTIPPTETLAPSFAPELSLKLSELELI